MNSNCELNQSGRKSLISDECVPIATEVEVFVSNKSDCSTSVSKSCDKSDTLVSVSDKSMTMIAPLSQTQTALEMNINSSTDTSLLQRSRTLGSTLQIEPSHTQKKRRKRIRYFGDCDSSDITSPKKARIMWDMAKKEIKNKNRQIATLSQANLRLRNKIHNTQSLIAYLKEKLSISETAQNSTQSALSGSGITVLNKMMQHHGKEKFSPELREFALTLNSYSAKAYEFVRQQCNNTLPHPRTLTRWFRNIDGAPGFTEESKSVTTQSSRD